MTECLLEGGMPEQALEFASSRLKVSREEPLDALERELTDVHRFVLNEILEHIRDLEARIVRFDSEQLNGLELYRWAVDLIQTILELTKLESPCSLSRSEWKWRRSDWRTAWHHRQALVQATTNQRERGNQDECVKGIGMFAVC